MAGFVQVVKDRVGVVKTRVTWSYIKTHLTKDKIIVFILIALLWGFSTVPLFVFYLTPKNQRDLEVTFDGNTTERNLAPPGCNLTSRDNATMENCSYENFYFEESTNSCVPNCYTWTSYAPATSAVMDGLPLLCSCMATLTSIIVIIMAFIRRKTIFHFPSVLVLYMSLSCLLYYGLIVIGYINKYKLFCTSMNLVESQLFPTPYCVLTGAITDYHTIQLSILVFSHILSIYFLIFYPLQAKRLLSSSQLKYVHLCVVLVGLLAPLLGPLTTILHNLSDQEDPERLGYRVLLYPPHTCVNTRTNIPFYTVVMPSHLLQTMSIFFLMLVLWKLVKGKHFVETLTGAEKKILVTLCYYTLLNLTVPTLLVNLILKWEQYELEIAAFFKCASVNGVNVQPPQISINPVVVSLVWLLRAFFPVFLLVYVVDFKKFKKCILEKKGKTLLTFSKSQTFNES